MPLRVEAGGDCTIRELLILINGRPTGNTHIRKISENARAGGQTWQFSTELRLQPGINRIEVIAVSTDEIRSLPGKIMVHHISRNPIPPSRLFLLTVGVSDYGDRELNLDYAASDAQAIEEFFSGMKGVLFSEVRTIALLDDQASDRNIIKTLKEIADTSTDRDLVILFLAGHGVKNEKEEFYFLCRKGHPYDVSENALSWNDFQNTLTRIRAKNILLLIDACHSGSILRAASPFVSNENLAEGMTGVIVFAACRGNEPSCEVPGLGGAFTQALLSGLHGRACPQDGRDGRITLLETERYVSALVPSLTNRMQHPMLLRKEMILDLPLSVKKGE